MNLYIFVVRKFGGVLVTKEIEIWVLVYGIYKFGQNCKHRQMD